MFKPLTALKVFVAGIVVMMSASAVKADDGQDCMQKEDTQRQIRGCTEYLNHTQGNPQQIALAHYMRANAYWKESQPDLARADFDEAVRLNPNDVRSYVGRAQFHEILGQALISQREYDAAADDFDRAFQLTNTILATKPSSDLEQFSRSLRQHADCDQSKDAQRRIKGCTNLLSEWKDSAPASAFVYVHRGSGYENELIKDYERAHADFDQAIALNPKFLDAYIHRADLCSFEHQYEKAAQDYERSAQLIEAAMGEHPDPKVKAFAKSIRGQVDTMHSYARLEERWASYLKEIQTDHDWSNWSRQPYDLYVESHPLMRP